MQTKPCLFLLKNVIHLTEDEARMLVKIEALSFFDNEMKTSHEVTNQMQEQHNTFSIVIVGRSQQNVHYLGRAFVGHCARPLCQR